MSHYVPLNIPCCNQYKSWPDWLQTCFRIFLFSRFGGYLGWPHGKWPCSTGGDMVFKSPVSVITVILTSANDWSTAKGLLNPLTSFVLDERWSLPLAGLNTCNPNLFASALALGGISQCTCTTSSSMGHLIPELWRCYQIEALCVPGKNGCWSSLCFIGLEGVDRHGKVDDWNAAVADVWWYDSVMWLTLYKRQCQGA